MIVNRMIGGCLAAVSLILLALVLTNLGSATLGIEVMDRLGLLFVVFFIAAQLVICLIFLRPSELWVPLLLLIGGTILFAFIGGGGAQGQTPAHHALFAGASLSGLATGTLAMLGREEVEEDYQSD